MNYKDTYNTWLNNPHIDTEIREKLKKMDDNEIKESFYGNLSFGTGGMRGILGIGTNKLNIYTVRKVTLGYASYLHKYIKNSSSKGIVIGHDNRHNSRDFCLDCAALLSSRGIKVHIFDSLRPTPEISYAIRKLGASGGIIITASHNPKEYNGYKVYDATGCQLVDYDCNLLIEEINKIDDILSFKFESNQSLINILSNDFDKEYYAEIKKISLNKIDNNNFKIVYSPQHGAALEGVKNILTSVNYNLYLVESQCTPDPNFSNTLCPNPEDSRAYIEAIKLAKEIDAHLILTTDPDGDRIGAAVKNNNGDYILLNGNQIGALILDYILTYKKHDDNSLVISTIVTSNLISNIAISNNVFFKQTLTGFKYIGKIVNEFESTKNFTFGVEESCGYLISNITRDKDAIQAALIIAEMACYYNNHNSSLLEKLDKIYTKYGYYYDKVAVYKLNPITGPNEINKIMNKLRNIKINNFANYKIKKIEDYINGYQDFPKSNVLKFIFEDDSFIAIRPSGTEPKYKIYFSLKSLDENDGKIKFNVIEKALIDYIKN